MMSVWLYAVEILKQRLVLGGLIHSNLLRVECHICLRRDQSSIWCSAASLFGQSLRSFFDVRALCFSRIPNPEERAKRTSESRTANTELHFSGQSDGLTDQSGVILTTRPFSKTTSCVFVRFAISRALMAARFNATSTFARSGSLIFGFLSLFIRFLPRRQAKDYCPNCHTVPKRPQCAYRCC